MPPTAAALHVTITHPQSHDRWHRAQCCREQVLCQSRRHDSERRPADSLKLRQALVHDIPPPGANKRGKKVSKHQCLTSAEIIRLIRNGENGGGGGGGHGSGESVILYTYRYTDQQNDSCIKMGSDESLSNVSALIVRDNVTDWQCPHWDHNVWRSERRVEADSNQGFSAYQPNGLPLG